jgi:hypothetical protein
MMSACDIAFRGNPGNTFLSILPNLVFERRPLHARHVFLSHTSSMLLNVIKNPSFFFSASTTSHLVRAAIITSCIAHSFVVPVHLFNWCTSTLTAMVHRSVFLLFFILQATTQQRNWELPCAPPDKTPLKPN